LTIMLGKVNLLRKVHRKAEAAKLEQAVRRAKSERSDEDPNRWMVDFNELKKQK